MNKKIAWILMIPICIIALYFLLESVMYVPEITGMEGTGLVLFIPIFTIICIGNIVVHIIAGLLGVFSKNNEKKYTGFMAKLYEWFQFKYFVIDDLFRIGYIVSALALTLLSFNLISTSFLLFILVLVLGNIGLRVSFELLMLFTEMCYNIRSINKKMK